MAMAGLLISSVAMGGSASRGPGGDTSGLMTAFEGETKGRQDR